MILLDTFCPNCSWWLLPLLLGAWLLGWLFWNLLKGGGYKAEINKLQGDVDAMHKKNTDLETQMTQVNYEREKVEGDYASLRGKYGDMDIKVKALTEQLAAAKSAGGDTSELDAKIAKMETDYSGLQGRYKDLEMKLSAAGDASASAAANASRMAELEQKLADAKAAGAKWEADYGALQMKYDAAAASASSVGENTAAMAIGAMGAMKASGAKKTGYAAAFADDNLQVVEGVGPKIEGLLKDAGIKTWAELAGTSKERLQQVLNDAGSRYQMHDPGTWAKQAELANKGEWKELIKYQRFLGGGKEDKNIDGGDSKVEKLYVKVSGFKSFSPDDLKVVEGIGPKIEGLLKEGGIASWMKLSQSSPEDIQAILDAAGSRFKLADPSTWAKQAELAVKGEWDALKEYQDFLQGGRE